MTTSPVLSIYDAKAEAFLPPTVVDSIGGALRELEYCVQKNESHEFAKYPSDYTVYEIGQFDKHTGHITPSEKRHIVNLSEYKH